MWIFFWKRHIKLTFYFKIIPIPLNFTTKWHVIYPSLKNHKKQQHFDRGTTKELSEITDTEQVIPYKQYKAS